MAARTSLASAVISATRAAGHTLGLLRLPQSVATPSSATTANALPAMLYGSAAASSEGRNAVAMSPHGSAAGPMACHSESVGVYVSRSNEYCASSSRADVDCCWYRKAATTVPMAAVQLAVNGVASPVALK
eukprot:Amastigsp_a347724_3.p3 type:complete len:131 gc:universal Amastigsp_a347724_3:932-540(-)